MKQIATLGSTPLSLLISLPVPYGFRTSFSPLDFPLFKPLAQSGSSLASGLANIPILHSLDSNLSPNYFYLDRMGGGEVRKVQN